MNILAIDTTTKMASVTVCKGNNYIKNEIENEVTHSEKLLPLINQTLEESHLTLAEIDTYACVNGPGSFTGIRIGLATLKAFAMVYEKPIFSLSSMDLLAYYAYKKKTTHDTATIAVMLDARNDRVYYQVIEISCQQENLYISHKTEILNDTTAIATEACQTLAPTDWIQAPAQYPSTIDLIIAYQELGDVNQYLFDTNTLDAIYARPSQAERMKKNANS